MSDHEKSTTGSSIPGFSRRSVLKAAGATTAGVALFSGTASASDDLAVFDIKCIGDKVEVTLKNIDEFRSGDDLSPADLYNNKNLEVYLGTLNNIDVVDDDLVGARSEIEPCFFDTSKSDAFCEDVAFPESANVVGDTVVYTFDRAEAGLGSAVNSPDSVVLAGVFDDPDGNLQDGTVQSFDSLGPDGQNIIEFDPTTCCIECESGEELLVKYEWEDGEFITEGSDDQISLDESSIVLDEDGEPQEVCFDTTYCVVDAAVKAGQEYAIYEGDEDGRVCVTGIDGKAISNVQFFCEAPDDVSVGNSDGNGKGQGR